MKRMFVVMAVAATFTAIVSIAAAPAGHDTGDPPHAAAKAATARGVGIVRSVDAANGKVTLQHEAIESLGWPPMTMAFTVSDPKLLQGLAPGMKVRFAFVQQPGGYRITGIE